MSKSTKHHRFLVFFILLLCFGGLEKAFATESMVTDVSGIVKDSDGEPLIGVNVLIKGTNKGTSTDNDGKFNLSNVSESAILVISYIGYQTQEIEVDGRTEIDVTLMLDTEMLEEVVVVGYQSVRRGEVSNAISSIGKNDIQDIPVLNPGQALVGKIAGMSLQQTSGAPGSSPVIRIRGSGSITNGNNPLYVIDGYPTNDAGLFNAIPPSDIESIDVLKDAAAAAIYGSRAGNGVIVITTKKGLPGEAVLSLDVTYGFEEVSKRYELMNSSQYVDMAKEALRNQNLPIPEIFNNPGEWVNTDWQDAIFQLGPYQNYQLRASGGNENIKFSMTGGYTDQAGTLKNTWFKRYNARINMDVRLSPKLNAGINLSPSFSKSREQTPTGAHNATREDGIISIALSMPPILPIFQSNGDYTNPIQHYNGSFNTQLSNPVQKLDANKQYRNTLRMTGNVFLEYEPLANLKVRSTLSTGVSNEKYEKYIEPFMSWNTNGSGNITSPNLTIIDASRQLNSNINWYSSNIITYSNRIKNRFDVNLLLGYDVNNQNNFYTSVTPRTDSDNPIAFTNVNIKNVEGAVLRQGGSNKVSYISDALFGRFIITANDKYNFTASLRNDRSSRFGPSGRSGIFPSFSGSWRISEENFLKPITELSDLKLRLSYGITGNDQLSGFYPWISTLSQHFYVFGQSESVVQAYAPSAFTNSELNWEKNKQVNLGLDLSLLSGRFNFTIDLYERNSDAILAAEIPSINGISNSVLTNVGKVQNKGIEFYVMSRILEGSFKWRNQLNLSVNRNEILSLGPNQTQLGNLSGGDWPNVVRNYVNRPMGDLYLYIVEGTFNSDEDLEQYPKLGSQYIGDLRFKDVNGDGVITTADMALVGNYQPDFTFGFNNTFSYKSLALNVTLQGSVGGKVINAMERQLVLVRSTENSTAATLNRWKSIDEPGDGYNHIAGTSNLGTNIGPSTRFLYDASFLRVRNITMSYSIPDMIINKLGVSQARIFLTGQNLFTFSQYSGYNPEGNLYGNNAIRNGIDRGTYPISRNISFGLNIQF